MEKEFGIRVFFTDGTHQDYDPLNVGDWGWDGEYLWVKPFNIFRHHKDTISRITDYEIREEKINGVYVRVFKSQDDARTSSDIVGDA